MARAASRVALIGAALVVVIGVSVAAALWPTPKVGPTPLHRWIVTYEERDAVMIAQDFAAISHISRHSSTATIVQRCMSGRTHVATMLSQPKPPTAKVRATWHDFLRDQQIMWVECVNGIRYHKPRAVRSMAVQLAHLRVVSQTLDRELAHRR